jgi:precorrin-6A/cobalt-precorrin-6A reductase
MIRVLVLGGTGEARELATALAGQPGTAVVTSLAGRVADPLLPPGEVRIGGFHGELAAWLRTERIDAVVDATHPFAAAITATAVSAAATAGVPLLVLRRPGWRAGPGDDWRRVPSLEAAAAALPGLGERVLLTTGRQGLAAFAEVDCWFLVRTVDPPAPPTPRRMEVLLDRGPYPLDAERALLAGRRIDVLVTKDSGGAMTAAKLVAARELGLPVVMVDRPPAPDAPTVETVEQALDWLTRQRSPAR